MVGFNCTNINDIDGRYLCSYCKLILRDPFQLCCGQRICKSCLNNTTRCDNCYEEVSTQNMFYDRGMVNDMKKLNIWCIICDWQGLFKDYQSHFIREHSNPSIFKKIINCVRLQMQQRRKIFPELSINAEALKLNLQHTCSGISVQQSVEETSPHGEILEQNSDSISLDCGFLTWGIHGIKQKINDKSVLTSPPFYTSPSGYKMCVRLYLNGNGDGISTHISVYIVLMRGDNDAILNWPFDFQVIFCLYDLKKQKDNIIESFECIKQSDSFQRPRSEINIGYGISQFVPISIIQQDKNCYIEDDLMFLKVMVRKNIIPKCILSKIMNIDPGIPIWMQEELIEQEIAKNKLRSLKLTLRLKSN